MRRLALLVLSVVIFNSCKEVNPTYCPNGTTPGSPGCIADAPSETDAPRGPCQVSNDCTGTPNTPVCETKQSPHMCVQCTDEEQALCTGTTPLCKNNNCAACVIDSDCGTGGLCLPNGACATATNIIHSVSIGGLNVSGCGVPGGPGACTLKRALTEVTVTKNVIKLDDNGPYTPGTTNFVVNFDVTIDARGTTPGGAVLQPTRSGPPILMINRDTIVTIFGGAIRGATNVLDNDGIFCDQNATLTVNGTTIDTIEKSAINASNGCKLTVTQANINNTSLKGGQFLPAILTFGSSITLSRSVFFSNKGGGISVTNGTFVIVGNSFSANGDVWSLVGGVSINTNTSDPVNRIEFNTISGNAAMSGKFPGVDCTVGSAPITIAIARNNIVWGNNDTMEPQVGGTCKHSYSDIGIMDIGGPNDSENNLSVDPMFMTSIYDLHLLSTSPMIMRADPNAKLDGLAARDFDGDARIAPADIGFDQRPR